LNRLIKVLAACALVTGSVAGLAQPSLQPVLQNVVQLAASGTVEVPQDLLTIFMSTTREGSDAALLQAQLKAALDAALAEARKVAQPGQLDLRTGNFSLSPRYGRDGKSVGWQGTVELVLEGRDFARISAAAGRIQTLTVSAVAFGLSREQRARVEGDAQSMAIERFKARAMDISRSFGFAGYTLREVNVNANDQGFAPRPRMLAMDARAGLADAPVPVEAGKTSVVVTVSGSVQLK
jgi:predicted secreted protein